MNDTFACCVCYKDDICPYFRCSYCKDGKVCWGCMVKIEGPYYSILVIEVKDKDKLYKILKCPCCRQLNWKYYFSQLLDDEIVQGQIADESGNMTDSLRDLFTKHWVVVRSGGVYEDNRNQLIE